MTAIATLTMNPALDIATATPEVRPTEKLRCGAPRYDPGGGGINVARVIHALGGEARAVFPAGGPAGAMLGQLLEAQGVEYAAVPIAGQTRESLTVHEETSGKEFRFVLPGPELSAHEQDAVFETLAALDPKPAWLVASGSLPPGIGEGFAKRLAETARGLGARLVLDAPGKVLRAEAGLGVYLVKPNLGELEDMAGVKLDDHDKACAAARNLIAEGVAEVVVLSLGAKGAQLVTDTICEHFEAIRVESVSAVGAGDAMLAGLVLALSRGDSLPDAMRFAIATGAAATLRPGTQLVVREDVERLLAGLG